MIGKHTPGSITLEKDHDGPFTRIGEPMAIVGGPECDERVRFTLGRTCDFGPHGDEQTEANAERFVASWNACAGIPTEALESGVVAEMREALSRILKSHDPTDTTDAMEDDRDFAREVLAKLTPQ